MSARRLCRPVRSSCSARLRSFSSASMRAWSCASSDATVWMALSSSVRHFFLRRNLVQISWPVVMPPEINGAATADGEVIFEGS